MKDKIRDWLIKLLGINKIIRQVGILNSRWEAIEEFTKMGVDVHFNSGADTQIIIISHLNKGYVKVIDTRFDKFTDLRDFVKYLQDRYKPYSIVWDGPRGFAEDMKRQFNR